MEVYRHQVHLPCKPQKPHLLLKKCTSSHLCEAKVYFFKPCQWYLYWLEHQAQFLLVPPADDEFSGKVLQVLGCRQFRWCVPRHVRQIFSAYYRSVSVTVQGDNPLDSFFGIEFYRIGNGSHTNTICFSRLFMGKNFTMAVSKSIRIWHLFRTVFV